jgi:uncharacterized protein (TIGR02145 family)
MKHSKMFLKLALISFLGLILATCQKENPVDENQMIFKSGIVNEISSLQLNSMGLTNYLLGMVGTIETMTSEGLFNDGNANSLVVKIENAIKSIEKGNANAFKGQLNAVINEIEAFINRDSITMVGPGLILINKAKTAIILADGSFLDSRDGYKYPVVLIGDQLWMAENLRATIYLDGTDIPLVTDQTTWKNLNSPGYCWYKNDEATYKEKYGALYNWYAVETGNICPTGWHVPTDDELTTLSGFLINNGYGFGGSGTDIAKSLSATSGWSIYGTPGTVGNDQGSNNSSGFSALPGGARNLSGVFVSAGMVGTWWSSTAVDDSFGWNRILNFNYTEFGRPPIFKKIQGSSVRCLKD